MNSIPKHLCYRDKQSHYNRIMHLYVISAHLHTANNPIIIASCTFTSPMHICTHTANNWRREGGGAGSWERSGVRLGL